MNNKYLVVLSLMLFMTLCLCGCGGSDAEVQLTIEDQGNVNTETVGTVDDCIPHTGMPVNTESVAFGDDEEEA